MLFQIKFHVQYCESIGQQFIDNVSTHRLSLYASVMFDVIATFQLISNQDEWDRIIWIGLWSDDKFCFKANFEDSIEKFKQNYTWNHWSNNVWPMD